VLALEMFIISAKTSVQKEEKTELYLHIYIYIYIYVFVGITVELVSIYRINFLW
jgi:hypothetical protein